MTLFRPLAGLLLALIVAIASVGLAVARGQPRMVDWVELCGGNGAEVAVDAQGQPVGMIHLCPDCIAPFAFADLVLPAPMPLPPMASGRAAPPAATPSVALRPVPGQEARGPPTLI